MIPYRKDRRTKFKFDFPRPLLDRLLASEIVPRRAKIEAIASWRRELAEAKLRDPQSCDVCELDECLAKAERLLKRPILVSLVVEAAERIANLVRSRQNRVARRPMVAMHDERQSPGLPRSRAA